MKHVDGQILGVHLTGPSTFGFGYRVFRFMGETRRPFSGGLTWNQVFHDLGGSAAWTVLRGDDR